MNSSNDATMAPRTRPAAVLAGTMLTSSPLRPSGAYSAMNEAAPAYSPDAEKPCTRRQTRSKRGAAIPIEAYPGINAIAKVAADMIMMVRARIFWRPSLSP